jgi:hypothetical protein
LETEIFPNFELHSQKLIHVVTWELKAGRPDGWYVKSTLNPPS